MAEPERTKPKHERTRPLLTRTVDPATVRTLAALAERRGESQGVVLDEAIAHFARCHEGRP